ncbi:hypothetical protein [Streptomyces sp. 4R-3d]|uniref:hypothetical protein n=1 Tax=Streptomyces sp. 4R-3d TaxID=2559605 RepID=UPI00107166E6|nr:hypothetical protein [Streptomyces sp. 4R-3d]TFI30677.1 hypothetical protein E4P36_02675 [Streptomyces sp. 4R-3d]
MKRTVIIAALLLAAVLTGCGSSSDAAVKPSSTPTPSRTYDVHDCKALLERDYAADTPRDASADPECAHLTRGEYVEAAGEVLGAHKDDFLDQAAQEIVWDAAWDETDPDQQQVVCDRLAEDGAVLVGQEMLGAGGMDEASGNPIDMVQYFHDEKC